MFAIQQLQCPHCRADLVVTGRDYLETICEHVECVIPTLKDKYECSNLDCETRKRGIVWNAYGERYGGGYPCDIFIDNNDGPFGSYSRKANVEIHKHDEDYTFFKLGRVRLEVRFTYRSNFQGEILGRKRKLWIWIREADDLAEMLFVTGIRLFVHRVSILETLRRNFEQMPNSAYQRRILEEIAWSNQRWWRTASKVYFFLRHPLFYSKVKNWNGKKNSKGLGNYEGDRSVG